MSYRTNINGVQIFGNDDVIDEWEEALRKQGCIIDEEGLYEFEVKDFMALLEAVESYVERKEKENLQKGEKSLFDISYIKKSAYKLTDTLNLF